MSAAVPLRGRDQPTEIFRPAVGRRNDRRRVANSLLVVGDMLATATRHLDKADPSRFFRFVDAYTNGYYTGGTGVRESGRDGSLVKKKHVESPVPMFDRHDQDWQRAERAHQARVELLMVEAEDLARNAAVVAGLLSDIYAIEDEMRPLSPVAAMEAAERLAGPNAKTCGNRQCSGVVLRTRQDPMRTGTDGIGRCLNCHRWREKHGTERPNENCLQDVSSHRR